MADSDLKLPSRDDIRRVVMDDPATRRTVAPSASEQLGIVDALYRFAAGQDLHDRALFESAFAPDAVVDFTDPARRLGAAVPVVSGRKAIADTVFAAIDGLDTTHTVTNPRVTAFDGEHATLFALVEAQHLPRNDHGRHLLLKNTCLSNVAKRGDRWAVERMQIDNVWLDGDPTVLFPSRASAPEENPHA